MKFAQEMRITWSILMVWFLITFGTPYISRDTVSKSIFGPLNVTTFKLIRNEGRQDKGKISNLGFLSYDKKIRPRNCERTISSS